MINYLKILIIDQNPLVHERFRKILSQLAGEDQNTLSIDPPAFQLEIDSALEGEHGWLLVEQAVKEKKPYAILFVDIHLSPGPNCIETIQKIWSLDPDIQTVVSITATDVIWLERIKALGESDRLHILKKPFDSIEVLHITASLAEKWRLRQQIKQQVNLLNSLVIQKTKELRESLSMTKAALESTTDGILVISNEGEIIDYNQKFINLWRIPLKLLKARRYADLLEYMEKQMEQSPKHPEKTFGVNFHPDTESYYEVKLKDGKVIDCYSLPHKIKEQVIGNVISFRDVTQRKQVEEHLQYLATYDMLTDLPNRSLLIDRIRQSIYSCKRSYKKFALLFIDVDEFKKVNDQYGHVVGDKALKKLANRFKNSIRESDTLSRIGGDEFVILITSLDKENDVEPIVKKIHGLSEKLFSIDGYEFKMTYSIGVSFYPRNGTTPEILLKNADIAMYRVKTTGRDDYVFYSDKLNTNLVNNIQHEVNLFRAIENEELFLSYQPIVNVESNQLTATEVFLHWQHPKLGLIMPENLITIGRHSGLMPDIIMWMLENACAQNARWYKKRLHNVPICINLSNFLYEWIPPLSTIHKILKNTGLDQSCLMLEFSENILENNGETIIEDLRVMNEIGISIVIDNFALGFSCLSYLEKIPASKLVINEIFVEEIQTKSTNKNMVGALINLAHSFDMKAVAKGVRTAIELQFLKDHHCDEYQGEIVSLPLKEFDYTEFLKTTFD